MISEAQAAAESGVPVFAPSQFHPTIWAAAAAHWTTHQYRVAVREAAEALTVDWKARLRRHDVDDTVFWQQTLSPGDPEPHKPKLAWPGDAADKTNKSMRGGLEPLTKSLNQLATGLNLTVRNVTTHTRDQLSEQEAMERLAAYSFLARLLDACEIRHAAPAPLNPRLRRRERHAKPGAPNGRSPGTNTFIPEPLPGWDVPTPIPRARLGARCGLMPGTDLPVQHSKDPPFQGFSVPILLGDAQTGLAARR